MPSEPTDDQEEAFGSRPKPATRPCPQCGRGTSILLLTSVSNDGPYQTLMFECRGCGHLFWDAGKDA